ncbi:hypothetical protein [Paenibacillus sp. NPDC093718]|uniref:hypothetical protein n=1 Tax=Paenibacillus sp. NPDC093718 TaxID=3390601 RepID=UPI003D019C5B
MTTRKKSVRKMYNAAIHMTFSILGLYLHVSTHNLLQETFGPGYLDNERITLNLLYAVLILQFLLGLYVFIRLAIILYEYKQGIRIEEDELSLDHESSKGGF